MKHLTLEIESDLRQVCLVAAAIHALCAHAGMDHDEASQVELCLVEAVTNSIQHAYQEEPGHKVTVTITFEMSQLRFELLDSGISMPLEQVARLLRGDSIVEPDTSDLSSLQEDGRGLDIIYRTMDEIAYKRNDSQNRLTLTRYLREPYKPYPSQH